MRMRVRIELHPLNDEPYPYDHHYSLSGVVYGWMKAADEVLSAELHYSREIKLFTFSELLCGERKATKGGILPLSSPYIIYSSPSADYVRAFVEGVLSRPEFHLGEARFAVERVEVLREPEFSGKATFRTLSPIVVSTMRDGGEKWYLYPDSPKWYVNLERNLKRKYAMVHGAEAHGRLSVNVLHAKPKKYEIKGSAVRGTHMRFTVEGPPELIRIGYRAGFGERGAMGFGCVEVVER